jgi:hypothetical protein
MVSARVEYVSSLITQKLEAMVEAGDPNLIISKRKAINTLFTYAIFLEQGGQQRMVDAILRTARTSNLEFQNCGKFMWHHVVLYISRLFEKRSSTSLNRIIVLISPYAPWNGALNNRVAVARWAAASSAIPYTEEVGQSVVDALLQIAYIELLLPHIPDYMWGWLKRRPSLPPICHGLIVGLRAVTVGHIRRLGDIDILKSYFLLVWTDMLILQPSHIHEVEDSIREEFGRIGMEHHRKDLVERLDHVLGQLDRRWVETPWVREAKAQYTRFKYLLLEADRR